MERSTRSSQLKIRKKDEFEESLNFYLALISQRMKHTKCSLVLKWAFFHFISCDRLVREAGAFQEKSGIMSASASAFSTAMRLSIMHWRSQNP